MKLDRESQELEQAYPGILARLEAEPLDRLGREYRIPKGALFQARERLRRLRASIRHPLPPGSTPHPAAAETAEVAPTPQVLDPNLQAGLERAYPGISIALARRDDVEVAVQFGISLVAVARIRAVVGIYRAGSVEVRSTTTQNALPARLVRATE
jgi:hypothetical protein